MYTGYTTKNFVCVQKLVVDLIFAYAQSYTLITEYSLFDHYSHDMKFHSRLCANIVYNNFLLLFEEKKTFETRTVLKCSVKWGYCLICSRPLMALTANLVILFVTRHVSSRHSRHSRPTDICKLKSFRGLITFIESV